MSVYPTTSGKLIAKKQGDHYLIKDIKTGAHGKGNEDMIQLLLLCDGTRTVEEITAELSRDFEDPIKKMRKKTVKSIEFLKDLKFLESKDEKGYNPLIVRGNDLEWPLDLAYLEVTNTCNLRCIHCYKVAGEPLEGELSTEEWFSAIDTLKELGVITVAFTGGEPLMREDFFDLVAYAGRDMGVNVFTNGTLLTEDVVKRLEEVQVEKVMVSIDGATAGTHEKIRGKDTFERTMRGVSLLVKHGVHVRSNTLIYTENAPEIETLIRTLRDLGVKEMIFDRFMEVGRGRGMGALMPPLEVGETLSEVVRRFEGTPDQFELTFTPDMGGREEEKIYSFCGVGTSMVTIKANGDVVVCPVLSGPEHTAGNIREDSLRKVWLESEVFQPFRDCTLDDTVCGACPDKSECRGGCKARVFQHYQKVCMPDPWMCAVRGKKV